MGYDHELADRIRELVAGVRALSSRRMFGGLAFLINGNMSIAASGQGGLLVCARFEAPRQVRTDSTSPRNRRTCRRQPLQQVLQLFVIMCGGHATRVAAA